MAQIAEQLQAMLRLGRQRVQQPLPLPVKGH